MSPATSVFPRGNKKKALTVVFGLLLGFTLSRLGFTDFDEVHKMFIFEDLRLFLSFGVGVAITALGLFMVRKRSALSPRAIHKGTIIGGVLFGAGWALTGACPGVIFAQLGEGQALALISLAGAAAGSIAYRVVNTRWLKWQRELC